MIIIEHISGRDKKVVDRKLRDFHFFEFRKSYHRKRQISHSPKLIVSNYRYHPINPLPNTKKTNYHIHLPYSITNYLIITFPLKYQKFHTVTLNFLYQKYLGTLLALLIIKNDLGGIPLHTKNDQIYHIPPSYYHIAEHHIPPPYSHLY